MLTCKRVLIATICGVVFGFVCLGMASSGNDSEAMTVGVKINILLSRVLLGFTIGISALRLKWWLHGLVIGFIASLPMAVAIWGSPSSTPEMSPTTIAIYTVIMGLIYGMLTELITTVLFKAKPAWQA